MDAMAYLYHGDWVGDCPTEGCANTEFLFQYEGQSAPSSTVPGATRKNVLLCSYCHAVAGITWPPLEFMMLAAAVVSRRPLPHNRNWYPQGHPNATAWGLETGQTVRELQEENEAHGVAAG